MQKDLTLRKDTRHIKRGFGMIKTLPAINTPSIMKRVKGRMFGYREILIFRILYAPLPQ